MAMSRFIWTISYWWALQIFLISIIAHKPVHVLYFSFSWRWISIGEIPQSGITKSKTLLIKMLTVHLKILLESTLNQREYMRLERGHGKSQVAEDTEYFRPREDLDRISRRDTKKQYMDKKGPFGIIFRTTGVTSLSRWINITITFQESSPFPELHRELATEIRETI